MNHINQHKYKKVSENNTKPNDAEIIHSISMRRRENCEPGCVSTLTHSLLCDHEFLNHIGDESIANKKLLGGPCKAELRRKYNCAVNEKKFFRSYELYEDIHVDLKINDIVKCFHNCSCERDLNKVNNNKSLEQILGDWNAYFGEKSSIPNLKNGVQCVEYLQKQGCPIDKTEDQITIQFPQDREFTMQDEMKAVNIITQEKNGLQTINFKEHTITIRKADVT